MRRLHGEYSNLENLNREIKELDSQQQPGNRKRAEQLEQEKILAESRLTRLTEELDNENYDFIQETLDKQQEILAQKQQQSQPSAQANQASQSQPASKPSESEPTPAESAAKVSESEAKTSESADPLQAIRSSQPGEKNKLTAKQLDYLTGIMGKTPEDVLKKKHPRAWLRQIAKHRGFLDSTKQPQSGGLSVEELESLLELPENVLARAQDAVKEQTNSLDKLHITDPTLRKQLFKGFYENYPGIEDYSEHLSVISKMPGRGDRNTPKVKTQGRGAITDELTTSAQTYHEKFQRYLDALSGRKKSMGLGRRQNARDPENFGVHHVTRDITPPGKSRMGLEGALAYVKLVKGSAPYLPKKVLNKETGKYKKAEQRIKKINADNIDKFKSEFGLEKKMVEPVIVYREHYDPNTGKMVRSRDPWGNEISESIDRQFYIDTETGRLYPSYNDALQDISTLGKNTLYGFYSTGQVRAIDGTVIKKGELAFVDSASDQVFASPQDALAYRGEYDIMAPSGSPVKVELIPEWAYGKYGVRTKKRTDSNDKLKADDAIIESSATSKVQELIDQIKNDQAPSPESAMPTTLEEANLAFLQGDKNAFTKLNQYKARTQADKPDQAVKLDNLVEELQDIVRQGQDAVPPERTPAVKRRQPDPDSVNTLVLDKAAKSAGKSVKDLIPDNARPNDWEVGHVDESARTLTTKADETFEPQSSKKTRQLIDDARLQAAKTGKLDQRPPMPLEQASRKIIARSIDDLTDEQEAALTLAARLSNQLTPDSPIQLSSQKPIDFTTVNNARRVMEVAGLAFARQDFKPFIKAYRALTKLEASHIPTVLSSRKVTGFLLSGKSARYLKASLNRKPSLHGISSTGLNAFIISCRILLPVTLPVLKALDTSTPVP